MQGDNLPGSETQDDWVRRIVAAAPPLSPAQRAELAALAADTDRDERAAPTRTDAAA